MIATNNARIASSGQTTFLTGSHRQGYIKAAEFLGAVYFWGQGVAIDYERAMAAYKVAAETGDAYTQFQLGGMYYEGHGVAVDYKQARAWIEKAAAQDHPAAVSSLGAMYFEGKGVAPSWRRARELWERAIELGDSPSMQDMQTLTRSIADVTNSGKPPHTTPTPVA